MSVPLSFYGKAALALSALGVAAWQDVERRMVDDAVWAFSIPAAFFISACEVGFGAVDPPMLILSPALAFGLGLLLHHFGLYGGADVKALLLIASAYPSYPPGMSIPLWSLFPSPFLAAAAVAALFSAVYPVSIFISNLTLMVRGEDPLRGVDIEDPFRRLLLLMTARRIPLEELRGSLKHFPAEKLSFDCGVPERKPLLFVHAEAEVDGMVEEMMRHRDLYKDGVLASPTVPMVALLEAASIMLSAIILL